jgi:hypothetical protein
MSLPRRHERSSLHCRDCSNGCEPDECDEEPPFAQEDELRRENLETAKEYSHERE